MDRVEFTEDSERIETMSAWTKMLAQGLQEDILALVDALDKVEDTGERLREMAMLRRYRGVWRQSCDPILKQAQTAHRDAHEAAIAARDEIASVANDVMCHCSVLSGIAYEKNGDLARLREIADEVAAIRCPAASVNYETDLQSGIEGHVFVSRSMHMLVVLQREARRMAQFLSEHLSILARPWPPQ